MKGHFCRLVAMVCLGGLASCQAERPEERQPADLIVKNGYAVTMNGEKRLIDNATIVVQGSRIVAVGGPELLDQYRAPQTIDAGGDIVMPGMINTHTHVSMTVFRGLADDVADRLTRFIFPLEKKVVTAPVVRTGALLGAVEMVQSGVTLMVDMYYFEDEVARVCREVGMRGVLGETVIGFAAPDAPTPRDAIEYARRFIHDFKGDELVTPALAPHGPHTLDRDSLLAVKELSETEEVPVLIHLSETEREQEEIRKLGFRSPVDYLDQLGLLNSRLLGAHCIFVDDEDINLMQAREVGVAHNMVANIKSAKGVAPALKMFDLGMRVGLGTDGPMSGNTLDIIGQMGYVAKLHKLVNHDRTVMPAVKVVEMATLGAARAIHREADLGSLETGKLADIVIVDRHAPNMVPFYDAYTALVYSASAQNVRTTIINGRVVMLDRKLLTVDVDQVMSQFGQLTEEIRKMAAEL